MKTAFKTVLIVVLGNFLYNIGVVFFILPSGLITGGTTGIAIVLNRALGFRSRLLWRFSTF